MAGSRPEAEAYRRARGWRTRRQITRSWSSISCTYRRSGTPKTMWSGVQPFNHLPALDAHKGTRGVFTTTSSYSNEALTYANNIHSKQIALIDGEQLAELLIAPTALRFVRIATW